MLRRLDSVELLQDRRSSREEGGLRMSWESRIFLKKAGRSMEPVRVCWRGWSNKGFNFEVSHDKVITLSWLTSKLNPLFDHPLQHTLTGSIDRPAFIKKILDSQLILNPPSSLEDLLSCYNSTLSNLLNIHAPLITKQSSHANNSWFTSYIQVFKTFRRHLEHVYKRTIDPASRAEALTNLKSSTHSYHKLVIAAKQKYYSSLIHSSSSNPRHLWRAVNSLHCKSPSPLPSSIPSPSIAY